MSLASTQKPKYRNEGEAVCPPLATTHYPLDTNRCFKRTEEIVKPKCFFDNELCDGELWACEACYEQFCQFHSHQGDKGVNVECANCERIRIAKTLEAAGRQ